MSENKRFLVITILLAIVSISIFTIVLDFLRFLGHYDLYNLYPSYLLNRINVILATALVWLSGKESLSQKDNRLMKCIFLIICVGEYFFLIAKPSFAITAFLLCQCLLIIRHSNGLSAKLAKTAPRQKLVLTLLAFILASIILTTVILLYPFDNHRSLSIIAVTYWAILSMSLWIVLANSLMPLFPKINSRMIAIGMLCFYCCDILVGLDTILDDGIMSLLANSLIWVFYTPAITLLALSCYKYADK
ncbi:MAG: hypothetical protein WBL93_12710 [Lutisporaceae bacterium]